MTLRDLWNWFLVKVRLAATSAGTSRPSTFGTPSSAQPTDPGVAPVVVTLPESSVSSNQFTANGTVDPGGALTTAWVEWGPTSAYGSVTAAQSVGSVSGAVALSVLVTGLSASSIYHYRMVGQNSHGLVFGADETVTTAASAPAGSAPVNTVDPVTGLGDTTATLNGKVNPGNLSTATHWEWSTAAESDYHNSTPTVTIPSGGSAVTLTGVVLTGLSPGTSYIARLVSVNALGSDTDLWSFTTTGSAPAAPIVTTRPPDQVT